MDAEFINYIKNSPLPMDKKKWLYRFYSRQEYLSNMGKTGRSLGSYGSLHLGYGNYCSKIMIVIEDPADKKDVLKFLAPIFDKINLSTWNCYIAFGNKYANIPASEQMFKCETQCIAPKRIIWFKKGRASGQDEFCMNDVRASLAGNDAGGTVKKAYALAISLIPIKEIEMKG